MLDWIILALGISGVGAIAANFLLEAFDRLPANHHVFALLNLYGSSMLLLYSIWNQVWLFVALNTFLVGTGLYGLWEVYHPRKRES